MKRKLLAISTRLINTAFEHFVFLYSEYMNKEEKIELAEIKEILEKFILKLEYKTLTKEELKIIEENKNKIK